MSFWTLEQGTLMTLLPDVRCGPVRCFVGPNIDTFSSRLRPRMSRNRLWLPQTRLDRFLFFSWLGWT